MPFNPKLIQPDDAPLRPDGELQLPDELCALAEQLTDDAAHLSSRYPATREPQLALAIELVQSAERIRARSRGRLAMLVGVGAASVVAVACTLPLSWLRFDSAPNGNRTSAPAAGTTVAKPGSFAATAPAPRPVQGGTSLSLGELSGPEMEALFDLLQRDPERTGSVSF